MSGDAVPASASRSPGVRRISFRPLDSPASYLAPGAVQSHVRRTSRAPARARPAFSATRGWCAYRRRRHARAKRQLQPVSERGYASATRMAQDVASAYDYRCIIDSASLLRAAPRAARNNTLILVDLARYAQVQAARGRISLWRCTMLGDSAALRNGLSILSRPARLLRHRQKVARSDVAISAVITMIARTAIVARRQRQIGPRGEIEQVVCRCLIAHR